MLVLFQFQQRPQKENRHRNGRENWQKKTISRKGEKVLLGNIRCGPNGHHGKFHKLNFP